MGNPDYGGLDPIFWLHHANIDCRWEVWRGCSRWAVTHSDSEWLRNVVFDMHDRTGAAFQFTSDQTLDTKTVMHGYE